MRRPPRAHGTAGLEDTERARAKAIRTAARCPHEPQAARFACAAKRARSPPPAPVTTTTEGRRRDAADVRGHRLPGTEQPRRIQAAVREQTAVVGHDGRGVARGGDGEPSRVPVERVERRRVLERLGPQVERDRPGRVGDHARAEAVELLHPSVHAEHVLRRQSAVRLGKADRRTPGRDRTAPWPSARRHGPPRTVARSRWCSRPCCANAQYCAECQRRRPLPVSQFR